MKRIQLTAAALATGATLQAGGAQLQVATGAEYSSGKYGEAVVTETLVAPVSIKFQTGPLSLRVSIPYVKVQGPADITPVIDDSSGRGSNSGSGSSGSGSGRSDDDDDDETPNPPDRSIQGLGDASASATWSFSDIADTALYVDLAARVRLPTGDEARGLGNGTTDYTATTEIGWDGVRGGVFLSAGRRLLENKPGVARADGWQASAGYWRHIGKTSVFGMQGNWRAASIPGAPDSRSVDAYLTRGLGRHWKLEFSGSAGLSDANPDYVVGLGFIWRIGRR